MTSTVRPADTFSDPWQDDIDPWQPVFAASPPPAVAPAFDAAEDLWQPSVIDPWQDGTEDRWQLP